MSNPYVTNVTIKNNQVVLTIKVDDVPPGESLEISGQATQSDGALAVFYDLQTVPEPNPDGTIYMYVKAVSSQGFKKGRAVTVVLRAARVWTTVLGESQPEEGPTALQVTQGQTSDEGTTWNVVREVTYAGPWSAGQTGQAPAGTEASFPGGA